MDIPLVCSVRSATWGKLSFLGKCSVMNTAIVCPVCIDADGGRCEISKERLIRCAVCGEYTVSAELLIKTLYSGTPDGMGGVLELEATQRRMLSHLVRTRSNRLGKNTMGTPVLTEESLTVVRTRVSLPLPRQQALNLIRFLGVHERNCGEPLSQLPEHIHAAIGAMNWRGVNRLVDELQNRGLVVTDGIGTAVRVDPVTRKADQAFTNIRLSLEGWKKYETGRAGRLDRDL